MNWVTPVVCALLIGMVVAAASEWLSARDRSELKLPRLSRSFRWWRQLIVIALTGILCAVLYVATMQLGCLETDEVQPSGIGRTWRFAYHAVLLCGLILATVVDFDCYTIPDAITVPGTLIGVMGACLIGEVQICHLWVDWSHAIPQLRGPLIPSWYDGHRFWHGLAWSFAGLATGASITWLTRFFSSRVLGQEAMGFGDVTLMAMIGSFLGWQAVTLVFLLAPLAGLTVGVLLRMLSGRTYLPYGPWLSIAALLVLLNWSHLWHQTRLIFSDGLSLVVLAGFGAAAFVALLWMLQLYKSIPTRLHEK